MSEDNIVSKIITEEEWIEQMKKNCLSSNPPVSLKACLEVGNAMGWLISGEGAKIEEIKFRGLGDEEDEQVQDVDNGEDGI